MNGLSSPVKYIIPVLTPTNVTAIAKLANKIPDGVSYIYMPAYVKTAVKIAKDYEIYLYLANKTLNAVHHISVH